MVYTASGFFGKEVRIMAEAQKNGSIDRKKRVQRLKKIIIISLIVSILVPWVLCAVLFCMVGNLKQENRQKKEELAVKISALEEQSADLETKLQRIGELESLVEGLLQDAQKDGENQETDSQKQEIIQTGQDTIPDTTDHKVYLTFDDGPSGNTDRILDILKEYNVKATFFVLGKETEKDKQTLNRIVEEGHALGMHSYSHKYEEVYASRESFAADFKRLQEYLYQVTGVESHLYRFPGGSSNSVTNTDIHELIDYLGEQETVYFDWNIASGDAAKETLSAETIFRNSTTGILDRPASVILFHDAVGRESTVEALPYVIEAILGMENTQILPLTPECEPIQHIRPGDKR